MVYNKRLLFTAKHNHLIPFVDALVPRVRVMSMQNMFFEQTNANPKYHP